MNLTLNDLNYSVYSEKLKGLMNILSDEEKDFITNEIKNLSIDEFIGLYYSCKASDYSIEETLNKIAIVDAFLDNRIRTCKKTKGSGSSFTGKKIKVTRVINSKVFPIGIFGVIYDIVLCDKSAEFDGYELSLYEYEIE